MILLPLLLHFSAFAGVDSVSLRFRPHVEHTRPHLREPVDPEVYMNAVRLITSKGYPCEEHWTTTDDGYILNMQRIPAGKRLQDSVYTGEAPYPRRPILLQHGLLGSSTNFLTNLANESLAYILADEGLDVWLGNSRGNVYSRNHTSLHPSQVEFWDWSWDEMAKYDLKAMFDYILTYTEHTDLYYVGHSQGTLIGFAGFSSSFELASKVRTFFAMGPVTTVGSIKSPIRYLAPFSHEIEFLVDLLGPGEFLPNDEIMKWLARGICNEGVVICENVFFLLGGFDKSQINESRVPVYVAHNPAGTSAKNMVHFAQQVLSNKFQMFDYGSAEENMKHYNQSTAPLYNLDNLYNSVALFWGDMDWLADPKDVEGLIPKIKNLVVNKQIQAWDHFDFIWGMDAPTVCYQDIIKIIRQKENWD